LSVTPAAVAVGVALIKRFEGCVLHPYQDSVGVWTIGWGDTILADGSKVTMQTPPITQDQADALRDHQLEVGVIQPLEKLIGVALSDNQWGALLSLVWNIGAPAFAASSVLKAINLGQFDTAGQDFLEWDHAGGRVSEPLLQRRKAELAVWGGATVA